MQCILEFVVNFYDEMNGPLRPSMVTAAQTKVKSGFLWWRACQGLHMDILKDLFIHYTFECGVNGLNGGEFVVGNTQRSTETTILIKRM